MKRNVLVLATLISALLYACRPSPSPTYVSPTKKTSVPTPQTKINPTSVSPSAAAEFSIPYTAERAPSGVLDQLSWFGQGGGQGELNWYSGTSNCSSCDLEIKNNRLILTGFTSNQSLFIPLYVGNKNNTNDCAEPEATYVAGLNVSVNSSGYANIKLAGNTNQGVFASGVYDQKTRKELVIINVDLVENKCSYITSQNSCSGAPPQKLEIGDMAYVCTRSDSVALREGPGKSYGILKRLVSGADIKIIGGPKCANNWSWWKVETESGYVGWMAEGGDSTDPYYICPR